MTVAVPTTTKNRWVILLGGVMVQLAIGAVYAWSTFGKALVAPESAMQLGKVAAAVPFEVAIGMIFVGSFVGGKIQDSKGPRTVALVGVVIYSLGIMLSSFAREPGDLWILILGYGLLGGVGLGMAYIVPIALLQKWFPDKAGLITGIAVGGFGFGAVITSPLAGALIARDPAHPTAPFLWLGLGYLVLGVLGALTFVNPPAGYAPPGMAPAPAAATTGQDGPAATGAATPSRDFTQPEALRTPQWYLLTAILAVGVTAGISLISVAAAAGTAIAGMSAASAATFVGLMGLFNGAGRILWAAVSDKIGKMPAFVAILGIMGLALLALPHAGSVIPFYVLAAVIYTCYGGAFGAMPSTAGRFFGVSHAGGIYGLMLIAWSIGGVAGPLLVTALAGADNNYTLAFSVIGVIALVGAVIPFITKQPARPARSVTA